MLSAQQVLRQVTESEQPREEVQLTELVPMKRSRIKENVVKDADATDGLKALRSITSDCNDKSENLDLSEICKNVDKESERQKEDEHQGVQKVRRRRRTASRNYIENTKSDDEENDNEVTQKKTRESRVNGGRYRVREDLMIARKKPARSSKETNGKRTRNDNSEEPNFFELNVSFDDDELAPEGNDEELYCNDKKNCFKDKVYVYRQETEVFCSNSANKRSESINEETQKVTCNIGCQKNCKEKCELNANGIAEENSEDEDTDKQETDTSSEEYSQPKNKLQRRGKKTKTSAEICADAADPSSHQERSSYKGERQLTDGIPKQQRTHLQNWQKKYCCVVCFARFKGPGGLRNHYRALHGSGPVYKCHDCGKEFPLKERLKLHLRIHTGFKPYKCPECDKSFARGGQLMQHRITHSQDKPFCCNFCPKRFTCAANLNLHVKRHKGQKDYKCDLCGRGFVRRDALKKHVECLHHDVKSFVCVICNKTFKGHLPQHMRTHAHHRPHGCATCGQRFAQKSQLTVHQRIHSGQRPFRCLVCWQAFAHSTALKLHTRRHTGERPFKCTECNAGFTQLPHWKKHLKCIHGRAEPYGCKWCTSFFRTKNAREIHMNISHPEMKENDLDFGGDGFSESHPGPSTSSETAPLQVVEKQSVTAKYNLMTVERMRLLLAVLLKRISKKDKLKELGFGKRLIDDVLQDSLISAGKEPVKSESDGLSELEALTRNLEIFLEWTMPKENFECFRKMNKTAEEILEALTTSEYCLKA